MSYGSNSERGVKKFKYRTYYHIAISFFGTVLAILGAANGVQSPGITLSGITIIGASISIYTVTPLINRLFRKTIKQADNVPSRTF